MSQLLALSELISAGAGVKGSQAPCCSGILSRAAQVQERGVDDMGEEWEAGSQGLLWVGCASLDLCILVPLLWPGAPEDTDHRQPAFCTSRLGTQPWG